MHAWRSPSRRYSDIPGFLGAVCGDATAMAAQGTGWKFLGYQRKWASGCARSMAPGCDWEHPLRSQLLREPSVLKIVLQRMNTTAQFFSFKRAQQHGFAGRGHDARDSKYPAELRDFVAAQEKFYGAVSADLRGQRYLHLWYETDLLEPVTQARALERIAGFLGLTRGASAGPLAHGLAGRTRMERIAVLQHATIKLQQGRHAHHAAHAICSRARLATGRRTYRSNPDDQVAGKYSRRKRRRTEVSGIAIPVAVCGSRLSSMSLYSCSVTATAVCPWR